MNFDDIDILEAFKKEQEKEIQRQNETYKIKEMNNDKIVQERESHKNTLKQRLIATYKLDNDEIGELFEILTLYEEKMDKIKEDYDFQTAKHGDAEKMQDKIIKIQNDMKKEFDKELIKIIKKKIALAKKNRK